MSPGHYGGSPVYVSKFKPLPIFSPQAFVTVAGGSADPSVNAALAAVLRAAKSAGVPRSNIENALKKVRDHMGFHELPGERHELQASGDKDKTSQLATYEAIAFGEVGIVMYVLSNRSSPSLTENISFPANA